MDDAELARLEHHNMVEATVLGADRIDGALVDRRGGLVILATGLPLLIFNQVLVADDQADPDALPGAVSVMRARGTRFVVNLRRGTDDRFAAAATALGLVPLGADPWMPGMVLHPVPDAFDAAPDLDIRRIASAAGLRDHVAAAAAGFGMDAAWLEALIGEELLGHPDVAIYVGYRDGAAVASGLGIRTGRTIGIYNIATVESARRRGFGAAMTARIVGDAAAAGCDVAILQASDMGRPIYERLGFRAVVDYVGYVEPDR